MRAHAAGARAGQDRIGAAGIISAVLQYYMNFMPRSGSCDVDSFLLAARLAEVLGGMPAQVENAAEIGLEHNLALTCDPVGGLVQVPCIGRNAMASVKATNAAQLALRGDGAHAISLSQLIPTVRDTGRDVLDKYKETSCGGLAVSFSEC